MPKKLPYFPFYPGDWLKDPQLTLCCAATRGIWIDLICAMHELDRVGELRGTAEQLARTARCLPVELVLALNELRDTKAADVSERNGVWVVVNRRMRDEHNKRKSNAERQLKHRNTKVTPLYEVEIENDFELFWKEFPSGRKKSKGTAREAFAKAAAKCEPAKIIQAATDYAASEVGRGPYVKMPTSWLNQECWNDDREAWRNRDAAGAPVAKEYKTITPAQFKQYRDNDEFLTRPLQDTNKPGRYFGQLKNHTKVECFIERKAVVCQ